MAELLERLAHAPDPAVFFVAALALAALVAGFSGLRRSRHIEDVPTARVRSAPQGYVELVGTARMMHGEPIIAPLSHTACCWYSYRIERRRGRDWSLVQSGTSDGIFLLHDHTGDCVIDPEGAEVTSRHKRSWAGDGSGWGGGLPVHARLPSLGRKADLLVDIGGRLLEGLGSGLAGHRYTEAVMGPGSRTGHFAVSPGGDVLAACTFADRALWLFDLRGDRPARKLVASAQPYWLAFTPDGSRVVSGNWRNGTVTLWDVERGPTMTLSGLEATVHHVAVSPDGRRIGAADAAGVHHIWGWTDPAK